MKKYNIFLLIFIIYTSIFISSCNTKCDCNTDMYMDMYTDYEVKKSIIEINTTNFATGIETIILDTEIYETKGYDSASSALLCQSVINPVRFFDDETGYFYVESNNAWMVAHASKPELIGTYRYNSQDINGKYYVRDMVEAIKYKGYGFVEYYFEHPLSGIPTKKLSFVKALQSPEFFIGSGFYDFQYDIYYTKEEKALAIVENVTKSMALGINGGFDILTDSMEKVNFCRQIIDNVRFFDNHSGYFFIYDFNCVNVAHGTQKNLEGQNLYDYQDSKGNYVIRGLLDVISTDGFGYYEYYWNNPVSGEEEPKLAFVYKIPGIDYFIGSGVYF